MPTPRYADKPLLPKTYKATVEQLEAVKSAADFLGITTSELIRQAVDQYLERRN
jgi:hypothetical protein